LRLAGKSSIKQSPGSKARVAGIIVTRSACLVMHENREQNDDG